MKKAVLGCVGLLLCLGLLAGCDTDLVGPGLAYHEPGDTIEEKTEPGIVVPDGDVPEGDDPDGDDNGGTGDGGDNNPNNPDNPVTDGGGSGDGDGDGDGSDGGEPEESNTYTLAVTTETIINNFTTNNDEQFTIGEGDNPADTCKLDGYTFEFGDAFSIAFNHDEGGNDTSARLWKDGFRVYGKDDFTIAPIGEWKLSSITLTFAVNASQSSSYTALDNVVSAGGTELSRGTASPVTVSGLESYSSVVVTPDNGSTGNIAYSSIEVTCVK